MSSRASRAEVNVLFTSAGRRVELLRAFRRAYQDLALEGKIVVVDSDPLAPAHREADVSYLVPRLDSSEFIPTLAEILRREQVARVFPLIDPEIPVLAQHRETLEASGARLMVVSKRAAETTHDKWLTFEFFEQQGVPSTRTWLPEDIPWEEMEYPVFVKPRHGSAGKDAFPAKDRREAEFFLGYVQRPVLQTYLPGPEITNDVVCSPDGRVWAVVSRKRIEVRWGEVAKGQTFFDREITDYCLKVARGLEAIGPITVQCILKEGLPHFTEINARFGGGVPLGIAAGVPSPRWYLAEAAGLPLEIPPLGTYRTGLFLTRFDDSFFLDQSEFDGIAGRRV